MTFPSKDRKRATLLTTDPTSLTKIVEEEEEEEEDFLGVLISHRKWAGGVGYGDQVWALRSRTAKSQKVHKQVSTMIIFFYFFFFHCPPVSRHRLDFEEKLFELVERERSSAHTKKKFFDTQRPRCLRHESRWRGTVSRLRRDRRNRTDSIL